MVRGLGLSTVVAVIFVVAGVNGRRLSAILGATDATDGEFPYQASIEQNGFYVCGGAIISNRHIVTAAHCLSTIKDLKRAIVRTGSILRGMGERHAIQQALYHHEYGFTPDSPHDIAVVILVSPITFDNNQKDIKLASAPTPVNGVTTVTGWGFTSIITPDFSSVLQKLKMFTLEATDCAAKLVGRGNIWTTHICAFSSPGSGTCHYDSGGPLVYGGELIGILSYGVPCDKGFPDVFTSTYVHKSWLESILTTT